MTIQEQIQDYINSQPELKRNDMQELHNIIVELMPECQLWFLDGKTMKIKQFPILISDMDHIPCSMQMEKPEIFIRLE